MATMELNAVEQEAVRRVRQSPAERQAEMQVRADAMRLAAMARMSPAVRDAYEAEAAKLAKMTNAERRVYRMVKQHAFLTRELAKPANQIIAQKQAIVK